MKRLLLILAVSPALAQEPPPIIVAEVKFCKVHVPYNPDQKVECRVEQIVPSEHSTNSLMGCMRAVSMGSAIFWFEGDWWETKGGTCKELPSDYLAWKRAQR